MKPHKRYPITVKPSGEVIHRVLTAEVLGNFNPIYCQYKGKRHLVKSEAGDLSDPFRVDPTYFKSLFIEV